MKKLFIALLVLIFASVAYAADQAARYSGEKAASGAIATGRGLFHGFMIATDSTTSITVSVYDNTAASGSEMIPTSVIVSDGSTRTQTVFFPVPIRYYNGIYFSISTTDCKYSVYYTPE